MSNTHMSPTLELRVLVVGESWFKHTIHVKGFDHFQSSEYQEGADVFLGVLRKRYQVTYVRAHEIGDRFPTSAAELDSYDAVVISDVGANSFLLTDDTFLRSQITVNRLELLADFVRRGGALLMVGGYLSFSGIDGRARFGSSPLADILPVEMLDHDDRVERPEGVVPQVLASDHSVLSRTPQGEWPALLGYNRVVAKSDSTVLVTVGDDPLLVVGDAGAGHVVAFTSDLAPHWAPSDFLSWRGYEHLWSGIIEWAARSSASA